MESRIKLFFLCFLMSFVAANISAQAKVKGSIRAAVLVPTYRIFPNPNYYPLVNYGLTMGYEKQVQRFGFCLDAQVFSQNFIEKPINPAVFAKNNGNPFRYYLSTVALEFGNSFQFKRQNSDLFKITLHYGINYCYKVLCKSYLENPNGVNYKLNDALQPYIRGTMGLGFAFEKPIKKNPHLYIAGNFAIKVTFKEPYNELLSQPESFKYPRMVSPINFLASLGVSYKLFKNKK